MNSKMKLAYVAFVTALLTGCVHPPDAQAEPNSASYQRELAEANSQCQASMADPALDKIRTKLALVGAPTLDMQANKSLVRPDEKAAIALWVQKRWQCWDDQHVAMEAADVHPDEIEALSNAHAAVEKLTAELYSGSISYGTYEQSHAQIQRQLNAYINTTDRAYAARYQAQDAQLQQLRNAMMSNSITSAAQGFTDSMNRNAAMVSRPPVYPPNSSIMCNPNGLGGFSCN